MAVFKQDNARLTLEAVSGLHNAFPPLPQLPTQGAAHSPYDRPHKMLPTALPQGCRQITQMLPAESPSTGDYYFVSSHPPEGHPQPHFLEASGRLCLSGSSSETV